MDSQGSEPYSRMRLGIFVWGVLKFFGNLAGGFKYFLFSSLSGKMIQFDEHIIFFKWVETKRPTSNYFFGSLKVDISGGKIQVISLISY